MPALAMEPAQTGKQDMSQKIGVDAKVRDAFKTAGLSSLIKKIEPAKDGGCTVSFDLSKYSLEIYNKPNLSKVISPSSISLSVSPDAKITAENGMLKIDNGLIAFKKSDGSAGRAKETLTIVQNGTGYLVSGGVLIDSANNRLIQDYSKLGKPVYTDEPKKANLLFNLEPFLSQ